ncbi:MAG: alpha/beta hydrolase fold domain-containing protein [Clostridia bacterium]|nr:alpha/beta hydrolase fold domain-containing protein [Clostridia bacterium]MBN2883868.1 alpha/beta hydrolase fold domain-containing protein [Clostridia bacterium]
MTARKHKYYFKDSNTIRIIDSMNNVLGKRQTKLMNSMGLLKRKRFLAPAVITGRFEINTIEVMGQKCVTIHPREKKSNLHLVYYHGGAYVSQGRIIHWILLSRIVSELGCRATYVDYPLAPEYNYKDTLSMTEESYRQLVSLYPGDDFVLGGDSAGGGLALVMAQKLKNDDFKVRPSKILMICPWLDLAMDNRRIRPIEKKDFILKKESLLKYALQYADGGDLKNPLVSPLFGSIKGLGKMMMTSGTHEIVYADCHELFKKAKKENADMTFLIYKKMPHVWIFYPIREARHVFGKIVDFLKS